MSEPYDNQVGGDPFEGGDEAAWARTFDAAYVAVSTESGAEQKPLSASLRERLEREGMAAVASQRTVVSAAVPAGPIARLTWATWSGWAAAAAVALAFLIFGVPNKGLGTGGTRQLVSTVDNAPDVVSWPFAGLTDEFKGAKGTVVWSSKLQKGYMKLASVPVNSPAVTQYQLWIVDPGRSKEPVDGGVFDIAGGDVVVPIDAKLAIGTPAAFAITREKPGGVVVSAGPLLMAAKP